MRIKSYHSQYFPFIVLFNGEEWRFVANKKLPGGPQDWWDVAVPGELLDEMTEEYKRIKEQAELSRQRAIEKHKGV